MACNFEVPVIGEESGCYILSPTSCLTDERTLICASRLEFGKHFTKTPVGANDFTTVQNLLTTFLSSSKTKMKGGLSNMLQCQADVARNLEHLELAGLLNEAEVRYAIIDPVVKMICGKWDLEVHMEMAGREEIDEEETGDEDTSGDETEVKKPKVTVQFATPKGAAAAENISPKSRADYTFYTLKSGPQVVALVVEAKCLKTARGIQHASAQAVGYFFKLPVAALHPPLVMVMTEEWTNVIFFPFKRGQHILANCVEYSHIPLMEGNTISLSLLAFILLFTNPVGTPFQAVSLPVYGGVAVSKEALKYKILTDHEALIETIRQLRTKLRKSKATKKEKPGDHEEDD